LSSLPDLELASSGLREDDQNLRSQLNEDDDPTIGCKCKLASSQSNFHSVLSPAICFFRLRFNALHPYYRFHSGRLHLRTCRPRHTQMAINYTSRLFGTIKPLSSPHHDSSRGKDLKMAEVAIGMLITEHLNPGRFASMSRASGISESTFQSWRKRVHEHSDLRR
jgi:hypothetical protein